jgi:aspartyl aminopeptidase
VSDLAGLRAQLDGSPTPRHLVSWWSERLAAAGFVEVLGHADPVLEGGFLRREGSLIAWRRLEDLRRGVRIVGAHTDSPGLHVKPRPDRHAFGLSQVAVEPYGSPLLASWLDRDLILAGHLVTRSGDVVLVRTPHAIARLPQLAIHLDRDVNERGLVLDRHAHLSPIWSLRAEDELLAYVCELVHLGVDEVVAWSLQFADGQPAALVGRDEALLSSGRLDNQVSCWSALDALCTDGARGVVALFDHEEVGSSSTTGAAGPLLEHALERLVYASGGQRRDLLHVLAASHCVSADNAHAIHPNHPERHDPDHAPVLGGGPALKWNVNQRYATGAESAQPFLVACEAAGVPVQRFSSRNTVPCGSTIGPITATRLGIATVDVGVPQLAMHSARETCAAVDVRHLRDALAAYLA